MSETITIKTLNTYQREDSVYLFVSGMAHTEQSDFNVYALVNGEKKIHPVETFQRGNNLFAFWFYEKMKEEPKSLDFHMTSRVNGDGSIISWKGESLKKALTHTSVVWDSDIVMNDVQNHITMAAGWAVSFEGKEVQYSVIDENGNERECSVRRTVHTRLLETGMVSHDNGLAGFMVSYIQKPEEKLTLIMTDGISAESYEPSSATTSGGDAPFSFKVFREKLNKHNIKSGLIYWKKHGTREFVHKFLHGIQGDFDYNSWFRRHRANDEELEKERNTKFVYEPKISLLVPAYNTPLNLLDAMIESVQNQTYENWELCIADGSDRNNPAKEELRSYASKDKRIRIADLHGQNFGISGNTNKAMELSTGDYIGLFDHDDVLEPNALFEVVKSLQETRHDIIYTDEDKLNDANGKFEDPNFKPDWDPDLFQSHNYITHFFVTKAEYMKEAGGFDSKYDGSQDYDLMLKCIERSNSIHHIPKSLYHWRMHEGSTALDPESKMYCYIAGQNALQAHLDRIGVKGKVTIMPKPFYGLYHTVYDTAENPLVSIIIPNCDHVDVLKTCVDSLYNVNAYKNFEIVIVENNSKDQYTFDYYERLKKEHDNVKIVTWKENGFNFSAINNFGVKAAKGDYLLFLNNDTEMMKPDALKEMLGCCMRKDTGAVGAKLLYADGTIQHAGVIIGLSGYAGHAFAGMLDKQEIGFMMRDKINMDVSAVTAACMMTKKSVFKEVGGFDEQFKVAANDIDYCMKVRKTGRLIVQDAYSYWHHYESKTRGYENNFDKVKRFDDEVRLWQNKWKDEIIDGDPYYNPNFKIEDGPYQMI